MLLRRCCLSWKVTFRCSKISWLLQERLFNSWGLRRHDRIAKFFVAERLRIKISDDMFDPLLHCSHLWRASPRITLALIGRVVFNFLCGDWLLLFARISWHIFTDWNYLPWCICSFYLMRIFWRWWGYYRTSLGPTRWITFRLLLVGLTSRRRSDDASKIHLLCAYRDHCSNGWVVHTVSTNLCQLLLKLFFALTSHFFQHFGYAFIEFLNLYVGSPTQSHLFADVLSLIIYAF